MSKPVRSAEVAELRAFCAAVDLGSLGRAARLLRVSQPALSKRLRMLEALAGARLLDRSSRGVVPTRAGERLYIEARKLLEQAEAVEDLLGGLSGTDSPVHLAVAHTIAEFVLPGPLVEFERRPERHLSVELLIANSQVVHALVEDGRAEFGIAAVDSPATGNDKLTYLPFIDDEVVLAVPRSHPWAALDEVPLEELVSTPLVLRDPGADTRRSVQGVLAERGLSLARPLAEVGSTSAAKAAALAEGAPALLSHLAVRGDDDHLKPRRVAGLRFERRFAIVVGHAEALTPAARALMEHLSASHNQRL